MIQIDIRFGFIRIFKSNEICTKNTEKDAEKEAEKMQKIYAWKETWKNAKKGTLIGALKFIKVAPRFT